jgi:hypothetical protein
MFHHLVEAILNVLGWAHEVEDRQAQRNVITGCAIVVILVSIVVTVAVLISR